MRKMRKTAKQGKLSLGTGQRVGLQGPRALTSGARNSMHMSHENRNPWESSHPTHLKCAQNRARRAFNQGKIGVHSNNRGRAQKAGKIRRKASKQAVCTATTAKA